MEVILLAASYPRKIRNPTPTCYSALVRNFKQPQVGSGTNRLLQFSPIWFHAATVSGCIENITEILGGLYRAPSLKKLTLPFPEVVKSCEDYISFWDGIVRIRGICPSIEVVLIAYYDGQK